VGCFPDFQEVSFITTLSNSTMESSICFLSRLEFSSVFFHVTYIFLSSKIYYSNTNFIIKRYEKMLKTFVRPIPYGIMFLLMLEFAVEIVTPYFY